MLQYWFSGVAVFLSHVMSVDVTINPACECVVYQSYGLSQGHFHSPNYPSFYAKGIPCILFTFIGDVNEIVELTFIEFNLKPRDQYNRCTDYLKLYLNLERPEVNENSIHNKVLCGNITDLSQKTFYSRERSLVMEFHTDSLSEKNFTGFHGRFRFLDANTVFRPPDVFLDMFEEDKFQTAGVKVIGTTCSYECSSTLNNSKGNFFSPLFPQNYPAYTSCAFKFFGKSKEKVKITFLTVQLYNNDSRCDKTDDYIIVYDGDSNKSRVKKQICGSKNNVLLVSSGPYMYVEFHSNGQNEQKGFGASYEFIPESYIPSSTTAIVQNCNKKITHTDSTNQNGTIQSPNFGGLYPSSITCIYELRGKEGDRVQIKFSHMDLFHSRRDNRNSHDCKGEDSVTIYIGRPNQPKEIATNCGQALPPQFMSNSNWMKVIFVSESPQNPDPAVTGFRFQYYFRTDFGITTGVQDDSKTCTFTFKSINFPNGTFTTPNFPWDYPKNTVCHYIFLGQPRERVFIQFEKFDVDGVRPRCDITEESDYVAFSNFRGAIDKGMRRLCGQLYPDEKTVKSDGAYFSVTFRSNFVYDGKGFKARYQFITEKKYLTTPLPQKGNTASSIFISLTIMFACVGGWILAGVHFEPL